MLRLPLRRCVPQATRLRAAALRKVDTRIQRGVQDRRYGPQDPPEPPSGAPEPALPSAPRPLMPTPLGGG